MRAEKLRAGKFDVDVALVERLIAAQFPHWAHLPVTPVANDGWDNWTFRLGDAMKVRLPSAEGYAGQAEKEARWLPRLAPHLPVPIPQPLAIGAPGAGYPWQWTIYDWLEGVPVTRSNVSDTARFAGEVAAFLTALQSIDPVGGPAPGQHSAERGAHPIVAYGAEARRAVEAIAGEIDAAAAHEVLDAAEATTLTRPPVWVHGDVAAGNLVVCDGWLAAVIDFGSSAVGDPSCDLAISWVLFDGEAREAFRAAMPQDPDLWARGRAWALWKAALVFDGVVINAAERTPREVISAVIVDHRTHR